MSIINNVLSKIVGSRNDRLIKKYSSQVAKINSLEEDMQSLSDDELSSTTNKLKQRIQNKESLDSILYLVQSISSNFVETIKSKKIIVFSERLKVLAKEFGFKNIEITENPADEDLVKLLVNKK